MNYFDIHSHLYFPDYDADRDAVIAQMKERGIWTTTIGTDLESSKQAIALAEQHEHIFASVGVHPEHKVEVFSIEYLGELEKLAKHPKVVAIGECGFDFFRTKIEDIEKVKKEQKEIFEAQADLAIRTGKALMIHARPSKAKEKNSMDAYEETLAVLEPLAKTHGEKLFGNVHFFVGDIDILKRFLDIGFSVSFTGVVTFASDYNESVKFAPLDMIHAETDAPFVSPVLHRGQRNSPEYVPEIVRAIALIRGENLEDVRIALIDNAKRLFKISL